MSTKKAPKKPSANDWTEEEKAELVKHYKYCIEQRDECIENLEKLYQKQKDLKQTVGEGDDDHKEEVQVEYDDLAGKAADQVSLIEGYLDILLFIEDEMEECGLSIP
ncbi:hypothetical protein FSPOR_1792 [Fusarium sporotrichioides]|uniref:Uncharacterized protein n=1 Tax=Fusarium sporotrichioides TaxID=5514 RepID=A0A395SPL2_FUSSP|nr:hypothetical protein FSPOR_1792 [Fusarium sporotrichioides]